jgi:hypothetical protein
LQTLAVQRDAYDVLTAPLVSPQSAASASDQPWELKSAVKRGLSSFRAGSADPVEDLGDSSDSSWLVLLVLWVDYFADLAVVFALFQRPRSKRSTAHSGA